MILPQDTNSASWNSAITKINAKTQQEYTLIDRQLDNIDSKDKEIQATVQEVRKQREELQLYIDFLYDLVTVFSYIKGVTTSYNYKTPTTLIKEAKSYVATGYSNGLKSTRIRNKYGLL